MPALSPLSFSASIDVLLFSPEVNQACGQFGGDEKKKKTKGGGILDICSFLVLELCTERNRCNKIFTVLY